MYPWPYNLTNMTSLVQYTNLVTGNWWAPLILVVIWFVAFISLKVYTAPRALGAACFITLISTIIFRIIGVVDNKILLLVILLNAIAAVWLWMAEANPNG